MKTRQSTLFWLLALALIDLGLPAAEASEITTGFYYLWPTAAGGR